MHKRKKPDANPTWGKGGSSASTSCGSKEQTRRHDDTLRKDDSSHDREVDRGAQGREAEVKSSRPSSREAWRERGTGSREQCNSDGRKDPRREKDASSTERRQSDVKTDKQKEKDKSSKGRGESDVKKNRKDKDDRMHEPKAKKRSEKTVLGEVDEDEQDRHNLAAIQRRMEDRKAARQLESSRAVQTEASKTSQDLEVASTGALALTVGADQSAGVKAIAPRRSSAKTGRTPDELMSADDGQREAARRWAQEDTTTTSDVTQSTADRGTNCSKALVKKGNNKQQFVQTEDRGNLDAQEYIASQNPPVEESVSSTVRLGRSFVSGAMGRQNDHPKMFEMAVELVDCSVPSRTTDEKAEMPVSDPPPNSIDSEMEEDESSDAKLSQSTTDTGVHIELPEENTEINEQGIDESSHKEASLCADDAMGEPAAPGSVATPVLSKVVGARRSVVLAEYNRMIDEIDASALVQEELRRTDPNLASVSSFLSVVSGGIKRKRSVKEA